MYDNSDYLGYLWYAAMNDESFEKFMRFMIVLVMISVTITVGLVVYANSLAMYPDNIASQAGYCSAYIMFLIPAAFLIWFVGHE